LNPSSLAGGVYTGAVQIIAPGAINTPQSINVTFNVQGPTLAVSATSLSFTGFVATSNPAAQNISISNNGAGTLNWTASSSVSWLQAWRNQRSNCNWLSLHTIRNAEHL